MAQVENNFLVALEGIKLTDAQKKKINSGIQEVIMRELAQLDHTEMLVKKGKPELLTPTIKDRPFIWGLWGILNKDILTFNRIEGVIKQK